ncbi:MAG: hypothetical protein KDI09_17980, partial [Halioglobus sp.]|nr:hypothetical protein [Halioglobus sp.]
MRKITPGQIAVFASLFTLILILAVLSTLTLVRQSLFTEFYGVAVLLGFLLLFYAWAFLVYRLSHRFLPLLEGDLPP